MRIIIAEGPSSLCLCLCVCAVCPVKCVGLADLVGLRRSVLFPFVLLYCKNYYSEREAGLKKGPLGLLLFTCNFPSIFQHLPLPFLPFSFVCFFVCASDILNIPYVYGAVKSPFFAVTFFYSFFFFGALLQIALIYIILRTIRRIVFSYFPDSHRVSLHVVVVVVGCLHIF